ncbi:MAG: 23S rRNA (adenine(2503)-C(2))-methyltransferase RlmN [Anaerolineae bacterium]|nr:23S rRNA (adenine(2503)-C(2))-methyltransferase RlmN [Candidatus Roseilinea sp.]MDW8449650.1 23S rRNA (adenine(2503)-C(2))-methyltransferase RlmN [Anaerolineae bacterium]
MQTPIPISLYDLTREQLIRQLAEWGEPAFRARQIWHWLYQRLAGSIDEMTDLPRSLRDRLQQAYALSRMTVMAEQHSSDGWTRKWLFRLADGSEIETVLMEYDGLRRTACVSSQAGCAMGCSFCATGQMGFLRNLRSGEIVEQAVWVARALRAKANGHERLSNLVLMGMGEPFANYNNVMEAVHRLMTPESAGGFGLGARKITISTVGIVPGIRRFAEEAAQINLAVSLHAATDALRDQLVPINRRYPLHELVAATRDYLRKTNRRVSYEWALIDGVNDTVEQAKALVELVRETNAKAGVNLVHVNMIPLNPTGGYAGHASRRAHIQQFRDVLTRAGIPNTLRVRRGIDISAGCGQLKAEKMPARAAPEKQASG